MLRNYIRKTAKAALSADMTAMQSGVIVGFGRREGQYRVRLSDGRVIQDASGPNGLKNGDRVLAAGQSGANRAWTIIQKTEKGTVKTIRMQV